jgi:hypothetical protein
MLYVVVHECGVLLSITIAFCLENKLVALFICDRYNARCLEDFRSFESNLLNPRHYTAAALCAVVFQHHFR